MHVDKVRSMIGLEMVKRDIEMLILAYLCVKRADQLELLRSFESVDETLRIPLGIGLICKARIKSEFGQGLQK